MGTPLVTTKQHSSETEPDTYPPELTARNQWMNWFWGDDDRKIPIAIYSGEEERCSESNRENWTNFDNVRWWVENRDQEGLTFVLSEDDPFLVIDGDDVRNPETGKIHPGFLRCIDRAQSYADVSVSGTGIHIILHGELPDGIGKIKKTLPKHPDFPEAEIEVYDHGQNIVTTGTHLVRTPTEARCNPKLIDDIVEQYGPKAEEPEQTTETDTQAESEPVEAREFDTTDKPDEWPACYYAGLRARERPPDDANKWDIDRLTAQLGLLAGFTIDEITEHFERYCPVGKWNEEITRKNLKSLKKKMAGYDYPPGVRKLSRVGILDNPVCDCEIHGGSTERYYADSHNPSIHALTPEERQTVSSSGILAVSKALETLRIATAAEISDYTQYSPKQTYRILNNDDFRHEFKSIEASGTSYWYDPGRIIYGTSITEKRLLEVSISLAEFVQVFSAGRERVDTDGKAEIMNVVHQNGPSTAKEIAEETDYSDRNARRNLNELVNTGFLRKIPGMGSRGNRYHITPDLVAQTV